jgi:transposase
MTPSVSEIKVQDIDQCGIVAGIIDQMCLVEQINQIPGTHCQEIVSPGQAVKAMILNGLGLVSAPLYLFEKFFVGKATQHLLGEDQENIKQLDSFRWLSRVPTTLSASQRLLDSIFEETFVTGKIAGYRIAECCSNYGGIKQRWLVIESEARKEADNKQFQKRLSKQFDKAQSLMRQLSQQEFACAPDVIKATRGFESQQQFHQLADLEIIEHKRHAKSGKPRKDSQALECHYQIHTTLVPNQGSIPVFI